MQYLAQSSDFEKFGSLALLHRMIQIEQSLRQEKPYLVKMSEHSDSSVRLVINDWM